MARTQRNADQGKGRQWEVFNYLTGRIVGQYRTEREAYRTALRLGGSHDYDLIGA